MNLNPTHAQLVLNATRLPARLTADQTALLLGFQQHDIATLIAEGLLEPLGKPVPNATKYFAAVQIDEHSKDQKWLMRATKAVSQHWADKNQKRRARASQAPRPADLMGAGHE